MRAEDLYGLPLDRFVPERGALARALRKDGERAEAEAVAGLRKPSVAAWAVNELVRTQGHAMAELFEAGDGLREAHANVLSGRGDGQALRAAVERERSAVEELVGAAQGLLTSQGHDLSATTIDRVADTLHAAALDEAAREQVREGRLERELRHVGLGGEPAGAKSSRLNDTASAPKTAPSRPARRKAPPSGTDATERGKATTARAERQRLAETRAAIEAAERKRAEARKAARIAEAEARREADRAARALRHAEQRHEQAARTLREAEDALAAARAEARAAAEAHRRAKRNLDRI